MSSELGYGSGITGLGISGWTAVTRKMLKKTTYAVAVASIIALGAETMHRGTSKNIKGWNIVYKYK